MNNINSVIAEKDKHITSSVLYTMSQSLYTDQKRTNQLAKSSVVKLEC